MLTLGIHDGHTATACLWEEGRVIACISEERLNREKEWAGFPQQAIETCLVIAGKKKEQVQSIGICSLMPQTGHHHYHNPHWHKRAFSYLVRFLPEKARQSSRNIRLIHRLIPLLLAKREKSVREKLNQMGFIAPIYFFEHHLLHAATAYYTNWYPREKNLILTLDGSGDAVCATVNLGLASRIERQAETFNYNAICDFYTRITQYLGMRPMSHEYKVMGLAAYAEEESKKEILDLFRSFFRVSPENPLQIINTSRLWKWHFSKKLPSLLAGKRFDHIAGALQDFYEEVVLKWIENAMRETGVFNLVLSGGGFMNVKLNYKISQLPQLESLFIFPGCGDESNPIGAAILAAQKQGFPVEKVEPLGMVDWGPSYQEDEIKKAIEIHCSEQNCQVKQKEDVAGEIAQKLQAGKIVGRFCGKMEWGARALGNRSILAHPQNSQTIHRINRAIKKRDFWMPFAPAVLPEYRERYLHLPSSFRCPFMTVAAETKEEAWENMSAALHPFDRSARAQVLDKELHPSFYDLVSRFAQMTGIGAVLNTSFNLHGYPIVCSPEDALKTFFKSDLDILQLENYIIEK